VTPIFRPSNGAAHDDDQAAARSATERRAVLPLGAEVSRQLWLIRIGTALMCLDLVLLIFFRDWLVVTPTLSRWTAQLLDTSVTYSLLAAALLLAVHYVRTVGRLRTLTLRITLLEEMAATLQDRLGQPLAATRLYARLLADQEPLSDTGRLYCSSIEQAADEAFQLLTSFLDPKLLLAEMERDRQDDERNRVLLQSGPGGAA
jgi:signal transduction histidine kinase